MGFGALLDGIPEAFVLGIGFALGSGINVAFIVAIFVSNVPQGIAGTTSLEAAGSSQARIFRMWTALTIASAAVAVGGFLLARSLQVDGLYSEAFAAGAVLTMLADSMMPEAFEARRQVGRPPGRARLPRRRGAHGAAVTARPQR